MKVALELGRNAIGIELNREYFPLIKDRVPQMENHFGSIEIDPPPVSTNPEFIRLLFLLEGRSKRGTASSQFSDDKQANGDCISLERRKQVCTRYREVRRYGGLNAWSYGLLATNSVDVPETSIV